MTVKFDRDAGVRGNRRALTTWIVMGLIAALFVIAIPSGATGALPNPALFQLDGNATTQAVDGPGDDWDRIYCAQSFASCATSPGAPSSATNDFIPSTVEAAGPDTTYFKGSATDSDPTPQGCGVNAPPKDEIDDAFAAAYTDPSNGHTIVYFGGDRDSNNGDAEIGFWFNGPGTTASPGVGNNGCGFTGVHQNGDLLVLANFTNGGSVANVTTFQWQGGPTGAPVQITAGNGATCTTPIGTGVDACGIANAATISSAWPYPPGVLTAGGSIPANAFFEGGVDLSAIFASVSQAVPCFDTFYGETRSSQSFTATLKDFAFGDLNTCGSIELKKVWNGTPGSTTLGIGSTANGTDVATKTVTTNDTTGAHLVNPGTYHVSETIANSNVSGQYSTSLTCVNTKNGGSTSFTPTPDVVGTGQSAGFPVATGDVDVCTYTNTLNNPKIAITKIADATSVNAGDPIGFTVNVSNPGTTVTNGVTVNDPLPAGVTWSIDTQSNTGLCSIAGAVGSQVVSCGSSSTPLAAGASFSFHVTATTSSSACATYNNTAHVSTSNAGNATASASITCNSAAIHIVKTADAASVNAGDIIGFTITVSNSGTGIAHGVTVNDPLPGGVTWSIATQSNAGLCTVTTGASQVLSCGGSTTNVAPAGSFSVHITAPTSAAACSTYTNTASVTTSNDGTDQSTASITCHPASIHITKTADAATVNAGDPIGFTVVVNNTGTGVAHGVTVNDPLPAGVTWSIDTQSTTGLCAITGAAGSQVLACGGSTTNVLAGGSFSVHITATTSATACATYSNTASVTTSNDGSGNASASITCNTASIHIVKTADAAVVNAGDPIGFNVTVSNSGVGTAHGVTVSDPLPPGVTWAIATQSNAGLCSVSTGASQVLSCGGPTTSVVAGGTFSVHITATTSAAACTVYNNTANVSTTNDGTDQSSASITCNTASIHIVKTADAAVVNAGDPVGFTVTVSNSGAGVAHGVTVSDPLPAGVTWTISTQSNAGLCTVSTGASQVLSCGGSTTSLAAGGTFSVHITATTSAAACGVYNNTANVTTSNDGSDQSSASITCNTASIHIVKTADAAVVNAGDPVGFLVTVSNSGAGLAHGVTVNDPLPAGVTWTINTQSNAGLCTVSTGASQVLSCGPTTVAAGGTFSVHITATTSSAACAVYNNTATVTTTNDGTDSSTASITCNTASIHIVKTADAAVVNAGDPIGFTVTVSNSGLGLAHGVTVSDPLPAGVTWTINTQSNAGLCTVSTGASQVLSCGGPTTSVVAGGTFSVHITATTSAAACSVYNNTANVTTSNDGTDSSTASITCNNAAIHIVKTADASIVNAGDPIGFTVTVSNSGAGVAHGVTVSDPLPSGVTWTISTQSNAGLCSVSTGASQVLSCGGSTTSVAAGGSFSVHITATTSAAACGVYNNTANVTTSNSGSDQSSASITCNTAAIHIVKTADAAVVNAGDPIGFTVTVSNSGLGLAHGVTVSDPLPAGVTWTINTQSNAGLCTVSTGASQVLSCGPATVAAGGSFSVHITALTSAAACSVYNNTANVTTSNDGTDQSSASITCNTASIHIVKTADAAVVNAGDPIGFTVTVSNSGLGLAHGVTVSDPLPAGVTWTINTQSNAGLCSVSTGASQVLSCGPATVAAGGTFSVHITALTSAAACSVYNNTANVTTSNDGTDSSTASITCNTASIHIVKTADAAVVDDGDPIGFSVTVSNSGLGTAHGVTVSDPLPPGVTWSINTQSNASLCSVTGAPGSQVLACGPTNVAAGGSFSVHITAMTSLQACSTYDNTANVTTSNDGTDSSTASITCNVASIHLVKTADATIVNAGDPVGFTIAFSNTGIGAAHGVTVSDPLPAGVNWSIDTQTIAGLCTVSGAVGAQVLSCGGPTTDVAAGGSFSVHITAMTSAAACSVYDNTANVTTTNAGSDNSTASITCNTASIHIVKTADAATVNAGDPVGFSVTVSNSGAGTAHGVTVNDPLPAGVTWSVNTQSNAGLCSVSGAAGSQVLACGPTDVAASGSFSVHITATTSAAACTVYDNTASVTTTNDGTDESTASITCNTASIHIVKTADAATVNAGDPVGFSVTVSNSGAGTAHGVTVNDPLPTGVTWSVNTQSNAGLCSVSGAAGSQVLACGPTDVAASGSFSVHITATTSAAACSAYNNTAHVTTTNDGSDNSTASITCNGASIHIVKTADAATVNQGSAVGFTITVNNSGAGTAHGVTVNDPLPAGLNWSLNTQSTAGLCAISGATGSQVLACGGSSTNVNAGGSFSAHVTATTAAGSCATYNNTATVTTSNGGTGTSTASVQCIPPPPPPPPPSGTPAISITKNPKSQSIASGATANFTIVVTNTGTLALTNVSVSDPLSPNCNQTSSQIAALIGSTSMAPGASVTYNCSLANVTASFNNVATTTGTGSNGQTVTATDTAPVTVMALVPPVVPAPTPHSSIGIVKDPKSQTIGQGGTAKFTITVTNTGDTTLSNVTVSDPLSTGCDKSLGTLAVGQSKSYSCTKANVAADFQNVATATGKPPTTAAVKATDHANITVAPFIPPQHPKIAISKTPKEQTLTTSLKMEKVGNGANKTTVTYGTAHFTIKVTNTGDVTLHNVKVTDPSSPGCDKAIGSLASHASKTFTCTRSTVRSNFTNVATAHGTSPKGKQVEATDHANVKVTVKTTNSSPAKFTG